MDKLEAPPRVVGLASAVLINLNGAVGAGIFALPALLYAGAGSFAPLALIGFAIFLVPFVAVGAKLSTLFNQSGGPQLWAEHAFGRIVGFQAGWLTISGNMAARAANFHVMVSYLAALFPVFGGPVAHPLTMLALILFFTGIAVAGTTKSIAALWIGTLLKLAPLLALCFVGLFINGLPKGVVMPEFGELESVALLMAYAYSGIGVAVISAGETKRPERILARAVYINLAVVALLYAFIQFSYEAIGPDATNAESPLAAAGAAVFGEVGILIISFAAIFSIGTGQLNYFIVMPRILYGMGRRGSLPRLFAFVAPRLKTPVAAILIYALIVSGLALSGTFATLAIITVAADMIVATASVFALYVMWRRNDGGLRASSAPLWFAIGAMTLAVNAWLLAQVPATTALSTLGLLAAGMMLYWLARLNPHEGEEIRVVGRETR